MVAGVLGIKARSFDNPELCQPTMDVYTSSSNLWDFMSPDLSKFQ
jgi:hypothetical protein